MWLLANIHRNPKKPAISLSAFDPFAPKEQPLKVGFDVFFADMMPTPPN